MVPGWLSIGPEVCYGGATKASFCRPGEDATRMALYALFSFPIGIPNQNIESGEGRPARGRTACRPRLRPAGPVAPPAPGGCGRTASRRGPPPRPGPPGRLTGPFHPMKLRLGLTDGTGFQPLIRRARAPGALPQATMKSRLWRCQAEGRGWRCRAEGRDWRYRAEGPSEGQSPVAIVAWGNAPGSDPQTNQPRAESPPYYHAPIA